MSVVGTLLRYLAPDRYDATVCFRFAFAVLAVIMTVTVTSILWFYFQGRFQTSPEP